VHIVESGDTLFGIALLYNVSADQIRALNAGSLGTNDIIVPGQELVISLPSETPVPTPLPPPPTSAPENPETSAPEVPEVNTGGASICVLAYYDQNNNTFRDDEATEYLSPSAEFTVADASSGTIVAQYTSDGVSEPHCFTGLTPGAYRVILNPPAGFVPSGQAEWPVAVAEGTSLDIQFGITRGEGENLPPDETTDPPTENEENNESSGGSGASRVAATLAKIGGIVILALAAGAGVLFVLNRRRI
jgi:hypothetical protein